MRFFLLFLLPILLYAKQFSVATYNVENLFDMKSSGHEYKQYIPNSKSGWNEKMLSIKIKNLARVLKDINADIISLQEVESKDVLKRLNQALGKQKYPYMYSSFKTKGLDIVLLSRYPLKESSSYNILKRFRPIHRVVVDVDGFDVVLFMNHWPAHSHSVKTRMLFAKKLKSLYEKERDYILLGDFNSPLKKSKKGWGSEVELVSKGNYNLWLDTPYNQRYSYKFYRLKNALDHIILSTSMKERYQVGSFKPQKFNYLVDKHGNAKRWQITKKGKGKHIGAGYSDHFALFALLNTKKQSIKPPKEITIKELLTKNARVNYLLKDVMVIHKTRYGVKVEDKKAQSIYIYMPDCALEIGEIYSLHVEQLAIYKGKKEIVLLGCGI